MDTQENWEGKQNILIILAHPDDPEFFLGATIARWVKAGHRVKYCLLTHGEKGSADSAVGPGELSKRRENEQRSAAAVLGVKDIRFLNYLDGNIIPDVNIRRDVVRVIREEKPDILVTCDPTNYFINDVYINHPDHRAAGLLVVDAVFPAAGNPLYFPELLVENILPHTPKEVWLSLAAQPNVVLDVTDYWQLKIDALLKHSSQLPNPGLMIERQRNRRTPESSIEDPQYEDRFHRLKFR
jgi:LmbE family N-acetylglucosaminyl deacetylase